VDGGQGDVALCIVCLFSFIRAVICNRKGKEMAYLLRERTSDVEDPGDIF
jgi:hypothetical protein